MVQQVTPEEIELRFTYHAPTEEQRVRYERLRAAARTYAAIVVDLTPYSREQSLALTAVEESSMWANAAIARREAP